MRIFLDTHIVVWAISDHPRLSAKARDVIKGAEQVLVSSICVLEVAIKRLKRSHSLEMSATEMLEFMRAADYSVLPVSAEHAAMVETLPDIHGDPFDRLIVSQAIREQLRLVTHDKDVARYSDTFILV